jgi:hypothetical protein
VNTLLEGAVFTWDLVSNNFPFWIGLANTLLRCPSLMWPAALRSGRLAGCLLDQPQTGSYFSPAPNSWFLLSISELS